MATEPKMVTIVVMGEAYEVPEGATIMGALEYAGFQLTTGVGCREGYCGACGTLYREKGDYKLKGGLACQTVVSDGMHLAQIPFVPEEKPTYDLTELAPDVETLQRIVPEVFRCLACNTCSKVCPQDIPVMDYVQALIRGDIATAADISFDCLRCGLCALRCPAEVVQYNAGILARRLYGRYLAKPAVLLDARVAEIDAGQYDEQLGELKQMDRDKLKQRYYERDIRTK